MAVYVAKWDCPVCGLTGNNGPDLKCTGCGASRPRNVRFYLPENAVSIADIEKIRAAKAGVNWICGHCHSHNRAEDVSCKSCGNDRDELSQDSSLEVREYNEEEVPVDGKIVRELNENELAHARLNQKRKFPLWIFIPLTFLLVWGVYSLKTPAQVTVSGFEWYRETELEHNEAVRKDGWSLPPSAFNVRTSREIHHYDKVFDHYETRTRTVRVPSGTRRYVCGKTDRGNGYFEDRYCTETVYENKTERYQESIYRDVPVYANRYYYEIYEWVRKESIKSSAQNQSPSWPQSAYLSSREWREGNKKEKYKITVSDRKGGKHTLEIPFSYWNKLKPGQKIPAKERWTTGEFIEIENPVKKR
ncbi:MAG: hypothetical protein K1X92_05445 [Bacteroidia bacterium]|nr:hypothetical protein [Bacteroidia bacterium]